MREFLLFRLIHMINFLFFSETIIPSNRELITSKKKSTIVEEAFERTLANCEQLFNVACEDIFDLLDPVISDSQCHIHAVFIISLFLQAYDKNGIVTYDFRRLSTEDRKLLSHVALLSLLKYEETDKVGFVVHSQLMDNLGIFAGKVKAEKKFIGNLKASFNASSVEYMKRIATGNIKKIFDGCNVSFHRSNIQLKLLPCYVTCHVLFQFIEENILPIVISLVRFNVEESDNKLNISSKSLLFYEFQKDKNTFVFKHKKLLKEDEKVQPTIAFTCYSVITKKYPGYFEEYIDGGQVPSDSFLTERCDIRDLFLVNAAGHIQLTSNDPLNEGEKIRESMGQIYKQNSNVSDECGRSGFMGIFDRVENNVFGCFELHEEMAKQFGIAGSRYSFKSRLIDQSSATDNTHVVFRRCENTFFALDHVKISTYSRESDLFKKFVINCKVPLVEQTNFNNSIVQNFLQSRRSKLALHNQ